MKTKNQKLVFTALILCVLVLFVLILGPVESYENSGDENKAGISGDGSSTEASGQVTKMPEFNLKYDKYLISAPYTYDIDGEERSFQFVKMREAIEVADQAMLDGKILTYVDNYKNRNGYAPYYNGASTDKNGNNRSASVPGYYNKENLDDFTYISDGTLVEIMEENDDYKKVFIVGEKIGSIEKNTDTASDSALDQEDQGVIPIYYVPSKYVPTDDPITSLEKVIAVDRKNQNIVAFEKEEGEWKIVSYSLATTGKQGKYHQVTPLGYYYAIEKRERFYYLKDGTNTIEGYAPYAVRFSAGAYIHGVSTSYRYTEDGRRIDGGIQEFSNSIGTVPLSHKCVRNYTSHAKFIYDWYEHGKTIVIVIE